MALPITPTPKLDVKESKDFLERVKRDLGRPATFVATPKLKQAEKIIKRYVASEKK